MNNPYNLQKQPMHVRVILIIVAMAVGLIAGLNGVSTILSGAFGVIAGLAVILAFNRFSKKGNITH